jgi:hypothetical protein
MKTTDIKDLTPEQLAEKVSQLESQLAACLGEEDKILATLKAELFPLLVAGTGIDLPKDTARDYNNSRDYADGLAKDFSIVQETFVWAWLEKRDNSTIYDPNPLEEEDFYVILQELFKLINMYRKLSNIFSRLQYKR